MARIEGVKEEGLGWLYDTTVLEAANIYNQQRLFTIPLGQTIPIVNIPKTYRHTNMQSQGFLGSIKTFEIASMIICPPPFLLSGDVDPFIDGYAVMWINDKPYPDYFPINQFLGGTQWREHVRGPAAGPEFRAFTGDGRIDNVVQYKRPYLVKIDSFENFRMEMNWTAPGFTPTERMTVGVFLFGKMGRPVG